MMRSARNELALLDSLRFLASFVIVLYHFTYYIHMRMLFDGYLAVDLFFVLSGYVIAYVYAARMHTLHDYGTFLRKRFARLYPLHALTLLFYVLLALAAPFAHVKLVDPNKYKWSELPANALLVHAWGFSKDYFFNTVSWSISAELAMYLLFPAILLLMRRRKAAGLTILACIYAGPIITARHWLGMPITDLTWNFGVLRALPSFSFGVALYMQRDLLRQAISASIATLCFYFSIAVWLVNISLSLNPYFGLFAGSLVILFATVIEEHHARTWLSHPWIAHQGEYTYGIYMIHPVVATVIFSGLAPHIFHKSSYGFYVSAVAALGVTYALSVLSYRYVECPARAFLGGTAASGKKGIAAARVGREQEGCV